MSIFDHYFGAPNGPVEDYTVASSQTASQLGKVYVRKTARAIHVQFTLLMALEGQAAEGWHTGVALDASSSMTSAYGRELKGELPTSVIRHYEAQGWVRHEEDDGQRFRVFEKAAVEDALAHGYFHYTPNTIEPVARQFIAYLADELDMKGQTTVIYWACGDGSLCEPLGEISAQDCAQLTIQGPQKLRLGATTQLKPALHFFLERFAQAQRGMSIFITDGFIDDLEAVKQSSIRLAQAIAHDQHPLVKCILIGVGSEVDEQQMIALDDLDSGTDIDIWDHKLAADMRDLVEIFAELVDEHQIVAPSAVIFDEQNQVVKKFTDGLPAKVTFTLPPGSEWFELAVMNQRIRQKLLPS